jgi:hypothetical protein
MTRPPDPGQPPPRRPPPGAPGGRPYGPPPGARPGGQPGGPRPVPPQTQPEARYGPERKGLLGTLLNTDFEELVTPKLIKVFYTVILAIVTVWALLMLAIGLWVFQYGWLLTVAAFVFVPPSWLAVMILVRVFMEGIIVHFKGVEYLRVMKDRDGTR